LGVNGATIYVLTILFLATFIRSALGFGEALVAVPLLALVMPVQVAAPLSVLVSITVAVVVVIQDWHHVHLASARPLVISTLFGIPLGLLVLKYVSESAIKAALGAIIIVFSTYSLAGRNRSQLSNDRLAPLFGFAAGILGGAYGMNGPPLAVYGVLRRWTPAQFRCDPARLFSGCQHRRNGRLRLRRPLDPHCDPLLRAVFSTGFDRDPDRASGASQTQQCSVSGVRSRWADPDRRAATETGVVA
jgi:hypothetical protein